MEQRKGLWFLMMLLFLPLSLMSVPLSSSEKEYLEKLGKINVCVDPDWEPFEQMDTKGNYTGIGADLLRLVAQRVGVEIAVMQTKDWDESVAYSKVGKCHIISFLNQTPYRDQWLIFTQPHFSDPNVFITREEHPFIGNPHDLIRESIVFPVGTAMEERIRNEYPNLRVISAKSEQEAFEMVSDKKADMAMRSLIISAYTIKKEGLFNLKISGQLPDYVNQLRIGVIKSEPRLRDILDKGIATITPEDRASIVNKYVSIKAQMVHDYRLIFKVILLFIAIGILMLWRYYALKKHNQELLYLSETDLLTKVYNRTKIEKELVDSVAYAKEQHHPCSILLIDIDSFKMVNDTFGHPIGDKVLIEIAHILNESIRKKDILGRWGGEEFLILCPNSQHEEAYKAAERIKKAVEKGHYATQKQHTISIGVATLMEADTPYTLISHADNALYQAKREGRNKVCCAL